MAEAEWEKRLNRLEEAMVVNAALINRTEQRTDHLEETAAAHDEELADLRSALLALTSAERKTNEAVKKLSSDIGKLGAVVENLSGVVEKTNEEVLLMKSSMDALIGTVD